MHTKQRTLYDTDFVEWTTHTAQLLREGCFDEVDIEHVAEELEDMGKRDRRELSQRLTVLISHLLKWQFQPQRRGSSWEVTIGNQRIALAKLLKDSPSLKPYLKAVLDESYADAKRIATMATRLPRESFPASCPYTVDEMLDLDYLP